MKKTFLLLFVFLFFTSPAFAEISQGVDKYTNNFTITSKSTITINGRVDMDISVSKSYSTIKAAPPNASISFLVIDNDYWFMNSSINYLIEGISVGKTGFLKTGNSFPQAGYVGSWGIHVLYQTSDITNAIFNGKNIAFRLSFKKQGFFEFNTTPEMLAEWKTVLSFVPPPAK